MITYIKRDALNIEKYNSCISNALNSRIYAYSWYLDIVTDTKWDVLVLDDYKAVMPLPKRQKYFINYIFLPPWSQQLGVFSIHKIESDLLNFFIDTIPKKFKLVDVFFNTDNRLNGPKFKERINYVLPLRKPYDITFKKYKKGRKSSVKQAVKFKLKVVEGYEAEKIIALFKLNRGQEITERIVYDSLSRLIEYASSLNLVASIGVTNEKNELIGGALFLKNNNRITYLFSSINTEGREKQAMSLLLDYMIQKFSNSDTILDFEGSMMNKIALFFRSFGAEREVYYHYKKYRLW